MNLNAIPAMTDPLGRHWCQPFDIRQAPMDDTHVLLSTEQVAQLMNYSSSYPSGTYDGKCWKRAQKDGWYLCWYQPHPEPNKIGIGHRIILEIKVELKSSPEGESFSPTSHTGQ
jgi:hypothetical protein